MILSFDWICLSQSFYDVIKGRLSEAACYLYVLESAVYMTAGIADYQVIISIKTTRAFKYVIIMFYLESTRRQLRISDG